MGRKLPQLRVAPVEVVPPTISTRPSARSVAVCRARSVVIARVIVKMPVAGSKTSAVATGSDADVRAPPYNEHSSLLSIVAVWKKRPTAMLPVL